MRLLLWFSPRFFPPCPLILLNLGPSLLQVCCCSFLYIHTLPQGFVILVDNTNRLSNIAVERDLEDAVSKYNHDALLVASSSETIPLVTGRRVHDTIAPSALPNVGPGVVCHKDVGSEEQVQSLGKAPGQELGNYDFFGKCFDVPSPILPPPQIDLLHVTEDHLASVFPQDNAESTRDFRQKLGFHMTWNQAEDSITSIGSLNAAEKGSCFEVGKGSVASENGDTESKSSVTSVNGDTEVGGAFSSSTHGCSVDHLEEIIEDAKTNKVLTLFKPVIDTDY